MARRELGPQSWQVAAAVAELLADEEPGPVLVACSGGPDSLALAAATRYACRRRADAVRAVVVDHGLQTGSADVAAAARAQLRSIGLVDTVVEAVRVEDEGEGPEAAARRARYQVLDRLAAETGGVVLLGHTLDDQAESVLLGLVRGSGTRSLAGMASRRGPYRRPLLGLRRSVTAGACAEQGIEPWYDPHNDDRRFARVRARHDVLPVLEDQLGPGIVEALARTATLARTDADLLDQLAAEAEARAVEHPSVEPRDDEHSAVENSALRVEVVADLHPALRSRVLRRWLLRSGANAVNSDHVAAVTGLITDWRGQQGIDVPGGRVVRSDGWLRVSPPDTSTTGD